MKTMRFAKGTGKVAFAILVGVRMPVLIWVALGVAVNQKLRQPAAQKKTATIGEILAQTAQEH